MTELEYERVSKTRGALSAMGVRRPLPAPYFNEGQYRPKGDYMNPNRELIFDIYEKVNGRSDLDWVEIAQEHGLDISTET